MDSIIPANELHKKQSYVYLMNLFEVVYIYSTGNARFVLQREFVGYSTMTL